MRDAVSAYWGIIEKGNVGEVYNIGSGRGYRIGEVLDILLSFSDCEFNIEIDESKIRPVDIPISICDNTKIKSCTGWKPTFSIEYTLRDILNYWRKRQEEV